MSERSVPEQPLARGIPTRRSGQYAATSRSPEGPVAMSARELLTKSALRKLPTKAGDGTPYCPVCRRYGELNPMVTTGPTGYRQCAAWSLPAYADTDRLTYEQLAAGTPCRGCGQDVLARGEPPSWLGKGTMYLTDEERAAYDADEAAFKERHPCCHALRWRM